MYWEAVNLLNAHFFISNKVVDFGTGDSYFEGRANR